MVQEFDGLTVIDGHHHLWELSRFPYRWLSPDAPPARFGSKAEIAKDYDLVTHRKAFQGPNLIGSVHVQANCGAQDPASETQWLQALSDRSGWPLAIVGQIDFLDADWRETVDRHRVYPSLRGLRAPVAWDRAGRWHVASQAGVLSDPRFLEGATYLARHGLLLEMVVVPEQLPELVTFARSVPDLTIVVNHFCTLERFQEDQSQNWLKGVEAIAAAPNVSVKLSGLWTVDKSWNSEILRPFVNHLIEHLGAERVLYGSNAPVECVNCTIAEQFQRLSEMLLDRSSKELEYIFSTTAWRLYGFDTLGISKN